MLAISDCRPWQKTLPNRRAPNHAATAATFLDKLDIRHTRRGAEIIQHSPLMLQIHNSA
jgi:hypothetical protein